MQKTNRPAKVKETATQEKIKLFKSIFRGRSDCYGMLKDTGGGMRVPRRINDAVVKDHLTGKRRIGIYPVSPDILEGSGTWWAVADIDKRDLNFARQANSALFELGITGYIERSKSKGYHIWIFFSEAIGAKKARALMQYCTDALEKDTGYRAEVFPKQDSIKPGEYGNYVYLPLFGKNVKDKKTVFLNPDDTYQPYPDQWAFLKSIAQVTPEKIDALIEMEELAVEDRDAGAIEQPEEAYGDMCPCVGRMMQGVSEGCRNEVAFTLAKHFRVEKRHSKKTTLDILLSWNSRNELPLEEKELEAAVKSAYTGKRGKGYTSLGCDDDLIKPFCDKETCQVFKKEPKETSSLYFRGNEFIPPRLANELMQEYSFVYAGKLLHIYENGVYRPIGETSVREKCRHKLKDESRVNRINEVIAHIEDLTVKDMEELNTHKDLINLENGMYDWKNDRLLPHDRGYGSTVRIPIKYEPDARCPRILDFFVTTLTPDCIYLVEELLGYALVPDTRYEKAFMLKGTGANGKSTFLTLMEVFIGKDNVSKIPLQELSEHRFKRADLLGKLVNLFADLDARALESTSYFKTIVSGDKIDAERKHQDPFYFRPFARLVYSANDLPGSKDRSLAYYRRWCIILFPNTFVGPDADKSLAAKLTTRTELSGLLNHALKGLRRLYQNESFSESQTVREELETYKRQNDSVAAFISERCELIPEAEVERKILYASYENYCREEVFRRESNKTCYGRLRAYPQIGERKKIGGDRFFTGIRLTES